MSKHEIPEEIIQAFHMMWDTFPEHARLIHKDRTVIAVNKAAEKLGMTVGTPCYQGSPIPSHKSCLAHKALQEKTAMYIAAPSVPRMAFWIPVEGYPDLYVHSSLPLPQNK